MIEGIIKLVGVVLVICLVMWAGSKLEKRQNK